jgi:hypothetical protein
MAVKRGAQNNQPWIITIVILSILIVGLGVATYFGFAGQSDIIKSRVEGAEKKAADMKSQRDWHKFKALLFKSYAGLPLFKNEAEDLNSLRSQYDSGGGKVSKDQKEEDEQDIANLIQKYDKETVWDPVKKSPNAKFTLQARVDSLTTELAGAKKAYDQVQKEYEKKFADLSKKEEDNRANNEQLKKDLDTAMEVNKKIQAAKQEAYVQSQQTITDLRNEIDDLKKKHEVAKAELQNALKKLSGEKKTLESRITILNEKIQPPYLPDYEQPKGAIDSLDREGRFAYINLGSADNVKPLLTFSIYAPGRTDLYGGDQGTAAERKRKRASHEPQPKGALEIVSIMGAHSSKARITDLRDANRDPIVRGDLLFNPIWSPGERVHVAVTGLIDLTGRGEDGTEEFRNNLERQGVIIDSYLDMKDLKIKGPGITTATNYLVVGQRAELDVGFALTGSPLADRVKVVEDAMNTMKKEAKDLGVTQISARNFMALVGYRLPKQITSFGGIRGYSAVGSSKEGGEEGKEEPAKEKPAKEKPAKPKAKEPAKDKGAEDKEEKAKDKEEKEDKPKEDKGKEKEKEAEKDKE